MKTLQHYIDQIEAHFPNAEAKNLNVSKAYVAWHLDHSLKVFNAVLSALRNSNPEDYKWQFSKVRFIVFMVGKFPRGKAKAPKAVLPPDIILKDDILKQLEKANYLLTTVNTLPKNANFKHPLFGVLNKKQTLKFLALHTKHHLKIINAILKTN